MPDEETGGFMGAKFVVENKLDKLNPIVVLDEGAFFIEDIDKVSCYVSYSQKKTLWLKVSAEGKSGHGAVPTDYNANNILIRALNKICANPYYDHSLKKADIKECQNSLTMSLINNTISVTNLHSGINYNAYPRYSEAVIDCRLLPDINPDDFIRLIKSVIADDNISIEVIKRTDHVASSSKDSYITTAMKEVIEEFVPKGEMKMIVSPVGTDSKYFREKNIECYGFFPIIMKKNEIDMMHGVNEKLSINNIKLGINVYTKLLQKIMEV